MNLVEQFFEQASPGHRGLIAVIKPSEFLTLSDHLRIKAPERYIERGPSKRTSEFEGASLTVAQITSRDHCLQMFAGHAFSWIWCESCDETVQGYLATRCQTPTINDDRPGTFNGKPL